jgi:hypothetical protein
MPSYDTNFNRVLITVKRTDDAPAVRAFLADRLTRPRLPEADDKGRIDIGIDQARNVDAADAIRKFLDSEWPDSAEWIEVEPTNRPLKWPP